MTRDGGTHNPRFKQQGTKIKVGNYNVLAN